MSADNWTTCPRCLKKAQEEKKKLEAMAVGMYGKASVEDFLKVRADALRPVDVNHTFREDFSVGTTESGTFYVHYSGACTVCGLSHEFEQESQVNLDEKKVR